MTCSFLTRCGTAIGKAGGSLKSDSAKFTADADKQLRSAFAEAESKLRRDLTEAGVSLNSVKRVTAEPKLTAKEAKQQQAVPKGSADVSVTVISPIALDRAGKVKDSFQVLVTQQGFHVGTLVQIGLGSSLKTGRVTQITNTHVHLEVQADTKDAPLEKVQLDAKLMKSQKLQLVEPVKNEKPKPEATPDLRQAPCRWQPVCGAHAEEAIQAWVKLAMYHLQHQSTPVETMVRRHVESDGLQFSMEKDVPEKAVLLIPFSNKFERVDGPRAAKRLKTKSSVEPAEGIYLRHHLKGDTSTACDYLRICAPDAEEETTMFWKLLGDAKFFSDGPSPLTWTVLEIEAPFKILADKSEKGAITKAATQSALKLTFPVLTNKEELKARSILKIPNGPAPSVF